MTLAVSTELKSSRIRPKTISWSGWLAAVASTQRKPPASVSLSRSSMPRQSALVAATWAFGSFLPDAADAAAVSPGEVGEAIEPLARNP